MIPRALLRACRSRRTALSCTDFGMPRITNFLGVQESAGSSPLRDAPGPRTFLLFESGFCGDNCNFFLGARRETTSFHSPSLEFPPLAVILEDLFALRRSPLAAVTTSEALPPVDLRASTLMMIYCVSRSSALCYRLKQFSFIRKQSKPYPPRIGSDFLIAKEIEAKLRLAQWKIGQIDCE